ncbi:polygalacturonase PglA [Roseinatronobacter sp. NSM]|uniref:polygalacturonase PglA n=1 Tax=Roseinatronobacter sp. NSM TaxID=3457785 RepID=UPI004036203E
MTQIELLAVTPRVAALRLNVPKARYHLPAARSWRLSGPALVRAGQTDRAVTVLHDLPPGAVLVFEAEGLGQLSFTMPGCTGSVTLDDPTHAQSLLDNLPDGGTLIVPAGTWQVTPLLIPSDRHIYLEHGARLMAPDHRAAFPILTAEQGGSWEGLGEPCYRAVLTAIKAANITISGPGLVDGGGARGDWWTWPKGTRNGARRARLLHLIGCKDVTVLGPTLTNSPSWTVHPDKCRNLHFVGLSIQNPPDSPNTDALNPESSEDVLIAGVHFTTGDDCIAIKAGKRTDAGDGSHLAPTRNIQITNCLMEYGHGGVVIGSEMSGTVSDVWVRQCRMVGTDRGLRIKTRRGRGGSVARIHLSEVDFQNVGTVLAINMHYFCDHDGHSPLVQSRDVLPVTALTPHIHDITLERISAHGIGLAFAACLGLPESPVRGVKITQVTFSYAPMAPDVPLMADGLLPVSAAGVLVAHCSIEAPDTLPPTPLPQKDILSC